MAFLFFLFSRFSILTVKSSTVKRTGLGNVRSSIAALQLSTSILWILACHGLLAAVLGSVELDFFISFSFCKSGINKLWRLKVPSGALQDSILAPAVLTCSTMISRASTSALIPCTEKDGIEISTLSLPFSVS